MSENKPKYTECPNCGLDFKNNDRGPNSSSIKALWDTERLNWLEKESTDKIVYFDSTAGYWVAYGGALCVKGKTLREAIDLACGYKIPIGDDVEEREIMTKYCEAEQDDGTWRRVYLGVYGGLCFKSIDEHDEKTIKDAEKIYDVWAKDLKTGFTAWRQVRLIESDGHNKSILKHQVNTSVLRENTFNTEKESKKIMMEEIEIDLDEETLNTLVDFARSKIVNDRQALINYGVNYALKEIINGSVDIDKNSECKEEPPVKSEEPPIKSFEQLMEESNIRIGDYVKVVCITNCGENGWGLEWIDEMNNTIGKVYRVTNKNKQLGFRLDNSWSYHPNSLKLFKRKFQTF